MQEGLKRQPSFKKFQDQIYLNEGFRVKHIYYTILEQTTTRFLEQQNVGVPKL